MFEDIYHDERDLPEISLRQIDLPEILKWKVGGKYYLIIKAEMTGIRNMRGLPQSSDEPKIEADFQVTSIRALGDKPIDVKAIEKKEFDNLVGRVKSGDL